MPDVILSMTSIPSRVGTLGPTLDSLAEQTRKPDDFLFHRVPGFPAACPPRARVVYGHDYGPITKLSAVLIPTIPDDAIIVTVDDDIIYDPLWLSTLIVDFEYQNREGPCAVSSSGWRLGRLINERKFDFISAPGNADVIEGWCGAAYRKGWFRPDDITAQPVAFRNVDDVWISSLLKQRGIRRYVSRSPPLARPAYPLAPGLHKRPDFVELNRTAAIKGFFS